LLDTSIVIHAFKDPLIAKKLDAFIEIFIPSIAVGELYYGAYRSANSSKHIDQINDFINNCIILNIDLSTAILYGQIKANLKNKGKPIPENDIWIVAIAAQHNLLLYTTDNHFKEIPAIKLI